MIAKDLISNQIAPLDLSDTGEQALTMMNIYQVKHLPIVDENDMIVGVISEDDLIQFGFDLSLSQIEAFRDDQTVHEKDHLFDVLAVVAENNLTCVSVLNDQEEFIGIITERELLQYYANNFSYRDHGSIIVIEMRDSEYSLSEISRLVESENCMILSSSLTKIENTNKSFLTLKTNKSDIQSVIATLERFEYNIKASFTENDGNDTLKDRYDALMNYLNV